jgi:DNA-binding transcriptional LysR family regulator
MPAPARNPYNLTRFDLVSIRLALGCVQHGSLSAAAREMHLAVAAASRRLRELESNLGTALFERHGRGLEPTPAGRLLARHALGLLQDLEQMGSELADLRQGIGRHVRLCASSASISQFLPALLAAYERHTSQVRVELEEQVSSAVASSVRDGRADLGVFVAGPATDGLECVPFREDELVVVLPAGHELAQARPLAFADALGEDWISLNDGAALLQAQQEAAHAARRPLRLRMQVRSFEAVCHLVASGLGIALLPKAVALPIAGAMNLRWRPLSDAWARRQMLLAIRAQEDDAVVRDLARFLQQPSQRAKARSRTEQ